MLLFIIMKTLSPLDEVNSSIGTNELTKMKETNDGDTDKSLNV